MEQVTITLNREDAQRICNALITEAVHFSEQSKTIGLDCMHPDFFHDEWNKVNRVWLRVYNAIHPETEKDDEYWKDVAELEAEELEKED